MSVAEETHHTKTSFYPLLFRGNTPKKILNEVNEKYALYLIGADDELERVIDSRWYKTMTNNMTPGKLLRILREACGKTLSKIGERVGVSAQRMSDYEAGRRAISKNLAKQFGALFNVNPSRFI